MTQSGQLQVHAGTYIKVTTVPGTPFGGRDDSYRILYLRPSGTFLFLGYWSGFERTSVVGRWSRAESGVELHGHGVVSTDSLRTIRHRNSVEGLQCPMTFLLRPAGRFNRTRWVEPSRLGWQLFVRRLVDGGGSRGRVAPFID